MLPASAAQPSHGLTVMSHVSTLLQLLMDGMRCTGSWHRPKQECPWPAQHTVNSTTAARNLANSTGTHNTGNVAIAG